MRTCTLCDWHAGAFAVYDIVSLLDTSSCL